MSKRLGDILVETGNLTEAQLHRALTSQLVFGGHLGTSLLELGYLDEATLGETLSSMFNVPYAGTNSLLTVPYSVIGALPVKLVEKHKVVPLRLEGRALHLAMIDPKNLHALDEISFVTGYKIVPYVAPEVRILEAMEVHYSFQRTRRFVILARELTNLISPRRKLSPSQTNGLPEEPAAVKPPVMRATAHASHSEATAVGASPSPPPVVRRRRDLSTDYWEKYGYGRSWQDVAEALEDPSGAVPGGGGSERKEQVDTRPQRTATPRTILAAERTPSLMETFRRLADAASVDEIISAALAYVSARLSRGIFFVARPDGVVGWEGRGMEIEPDRVLRLKLPPAQEHGSLLSLVSDNKPYYLGRLPAGWGKESLYRPLGLRPPRTVLIVPIHIKERVAGYIYGDGAEQEIRALDLPSMLSVCARTGFALQIIILRNKILSF